MKSKRLLEYLTNVAVIAMALVVIATYFNRQHPKSPNEGAPSLRGSHIDLSTFDTSPAKLNVVLALSTTCHFCEQNIDLYRDLSNVITGSGTRLLAVFPQGKAEASHYLDQHGIRVDGLRSGALSDYRITLTPTILFVDASGKVTDAWVGELEKDEKAKLIDQIRKATA
jgi:hypothetical protein